MANFQNMDDQDLWGSSNDLSETIGLTEECLMQSVKTAANYLLDDNVTGLPSSENILSDVGFIVDDFPSAWNEQDFFSFDGLTSSTSQQPETSEECNFPSQQSTLLDTELDQFNSSQPSENGSSGSNLHVLGVAEPIDFQQQVSSTVNSIISGTFESSELVTGNLGLNLNGCQVLGTPAGAPVQVPEFNSTSRAAVTCVEAGKKAPRRRRNKNPKEKLYMRAEPFSDEEEEKKRQNAVKAYKNRQKRSTEINVLKEENEALKRLIQEKDKELQEKNDIIIGFQKTKKLNNNVVANIKAELSKLIMN